MRIISCRLACIMNRRWPLRRWANSPHREGEQGVGMVVAVYKPMATCSWHGGGCAYGNLRETEIFNSNLSC